MSRPSDVYDARNVTHRAIETRRRTLREKSLTNAALLVIFLRHLRSALIAVLTVLVAALITFIAMVDAPIVMRAGKRNAGRLR